MRFTLVPDADEIRLVPRCDVEQHEVPTNEGPRLASLQSRFDAPENELRLFGQICAIERWTCARKSLEQRNASFEQVFDQLVEAMPCVRADQKPFDSLEIELE